MRTPRWGRRALEATALLSAGLLLAGCAAASTRSVVPSQTPTPTPDPGFGLPLDVPPDSPAALALADPGNAGMSSDDRALLRSIATEPTAVWIADPTRLVEERVRAVVHGAAQRGAIPVLVAYNIPSRDCGGHSSGSQLDGAGYREWTDAFVAGLGSDRAIVVVEPDALALMDCLEQPARTERLDLLGEAVAKLAAQGAEVYLDAGHSAWLAPDVMAGRLERAGVGMAAGFVLNVSNFRGTQEQVDYGRELAGLLPGDPHVIIDTSRNGRPSESGEWCNPWDRALGAAPTTETGDDFVDAYLWIKQPGNSDGECNGGPPAGVWWQEYALMLAANAR